MDEPFPLSPLTLEKFSKVTQRQLRTFKWEYLKTFYYVAVSQSFSLAAIHLRVTQSAVSRTIVTFERSLATQLFRRGTRYMTLTQTGEIVFKVAAQSFHGIETLITQIDQNQNLEHGDIRIWAGSGFIRLYLMPYIPTFVERYPHIRLRLNSSKVIPNLDLLETDVVIRPPFSQRADLVQTPLLINHVKLYASQDYLNKFGTPTTPEELDHHRLIAYGKPPGLKGFDGMNWHLKLGLPKGQERKAFIEVDQPEDRLELAAAGLGITTASQEHPGLERYPLVEVLGHLSGPTVPCYYIYSAHLQASRRIQLLKDFLVNYFTRDYGPPSS